MVVPTYPALVPRINFYGSKMRHGIFWVLNFGSGIFWGIFFEALGIFLGLIFASIRSSLSRGHLKSGVPPAGFALQQERRHFRCRDDCNNGQGLGTRDEPLRTSAWEATAPVIVC